MKAAHAGDDPGATWESPSRQPGTGALVLVGAPLGNAADMSVRAARALAGADLVAAEDTRRLARLARDAGIEVRGRVVSYFEGNEARRTPEILEALRGGAVVAVVTDGGMPTVSDPGYRLVRAAVEEGVPVRVVPGPSAVTTALAVSGLPVERFCFEGFLPRRAAARRARLAALAAEPRTMVFFEAPHRLAESLADLAAAFDPGRAGVVCRELTKTYEQVRRGELGGLAEWAAREQPRGEITVVVAGAAAAPAARPDDADLRAAVAGRESEGTSRREAIAAVAQEYGLPRREVYNLIVSG